MSKSDNIPLAQKAIGRLHRIFFERFLIVMMNALIINLFLLIYRYPKTGLQPSDFIYVFLLVTSTLLVIYRKKLQTRILQYYLIGVIGASAVVSALTYGVVGPTSIYAVFAVFLASTALGWAVSVAFIIFFTLFYAGLGGAVVMGIYTFDVDLNYHAHSVQVWFIICFVTSLLGFYLSQMFYTFVRTQAKLTERASRQKQRIEYLANHDTLTGLASLRLTTELIDHALIRAKRIQSQVALFLIDLLGLKNDNDSYGHHVGDEVLRQAANRIRTTLRESDVACRIGGDEFLILLESFEDRSSLTHVCERIVLRLAEPFCIDDHRIMISSSVGGAIFPEHASNQTELRGRADQAMYEIKKSGKNNFKIAA
jgi:diguanylate cyclase (GGDEF)-like protein